MIIFDLFNALNTLLAVTITINVDSNCGINLLKP